jgi:hypothetical protein
MSRRSDGDADTLFRLHLGLRIPLVLLLVLPAAAVAVGVARRGVTTAFIASSVLTLLMAALFLPLITRRVVVNARGITAGSLFSSTTMEWTEVEKVCGYVFNGRAMLLIQGSGRKIAVTDMTAGFRRLAGYVIEHASAASIGPDIDAMYRVDGRQRHDAAILWLVVSVMAGAFAYRLLSFR